MILYWALAIATYGAALAAVAALALAILRRWQPARNVARAASLVALSVFLLSFILLGLLLVVPGVGAVVFRALLPAGDPEDRARFLAEAIAETMNSSAMAVPTLLLAVPIWIVAKLRLAKLARAVVSRGG